MSLVWLKFWDHKSLFGRPQSNATHTRVTLVTLEWKTLRTTAIQSCSQKRLTTTSNFLMQLHNQFYLNLNKTKPLNRWTNKIKPLKLFKYLNVYTGPKKHHLCTLIKKRIMQFGIIKTGTLNGVIFWRFQLNVAVPVFFRHSCGNMFSVITGS